MFESKDEKEARRAAKRAAREAETARQADQRAAAAFYASPLGQAVAAREQGRGFFQVQLSPGQVAEQWPVSVGITHPDVLSQIEAVGWELEHVNHVWVQTGAVSRDHFLTSGQDIGVMGELVGIYLFRAVDDEMVDDEMDEEDEPVD
jgi:hypothetical protein